MSIDFNSIISGERFQQLCDIYCGSEYDLNRNPIISKQKNKHLLIESLNSEWNNPKLIFCYSCALVTFKSKLHFFKNPFVLVSHNEDNNITNEYYDILNSPLIIKWFAQNIMIKHPKLSFLPIGIANSMWTHGNINNLITVINSNVTKTKDVYFNFKVSTNTKEREKCKTILENKGLFFQPTLDHLGYLNDLATSKFAICPQGNGIDCHRTWECYYLNVIPIFLKSTFTELLSEFLPCILLDNWDDFNPIIFNEYDTLIKNLDKKYLNLETYSTKINKYIPKTFSHIDNKQIPLDYKLNNIFDKFNGFLLN
jgi:hypothetical protein